MRRPHLPTLTSDNLPEIFDEYDIEVRDKEDAFWYHAPILWIASLIVSLSGKDPSGFSQGLMKFFGGSVFYPWDELDAEDVRNGNVSSSDMPTIVHELTHCFQWIELGPIWGAFCYVFWPFPIWWTGRSTLEFEPEANEKLWLQRKYGTGDWFKEICRTSAETFTGSTYVWATRDTEGWYRALMRSSALAKVDSEVDAREFVTQKNLHQLFGGYNPR